MLYAHLLPLVEKKLGGYQAGFREGKSTTDQIFSLRKILEKTYEYNIETYHLFVDFNAAHDSVK
jgi:sorting nexin-29